MRKIALLSAVTLTLGALTVDGADARPRGHGYGHGHYGHGYYGRGHYGRGYAYGHRRGISPGAAVGLGIAGLAAGAIAAEGARRAYAPRYRYYDYGY